MAKTQAEVNFINAIALAKKYGAGSMVMMIQDPTSGALVVWQGDTTTTIEVETTGGGTSGLLVDQLNSLQVAVAPSLLYTDWPGTSGQNDDTDWSSKGW